MTDLGDEVPARLVDVVVRFERLDWQGFALALERKLGIGPSLSEVIGINRLRPYLHEIIRVALRRRSPAVVAAAVHAVLEAIYDGHDALLATKALAEELEAADRAERTELLQPAERAHVLALLAGDARLRMSDVAAVLHEMEPAPPRAAESAEDLPALIAALEEAATPDGQPPALLQFLVRLGRRRSAATRAALWQVIDEIAGRLGAPLHDLEPMRGQRLAAPNIHVVIGITDVRPRAARRYQISRWFRDDDGLVSHRHDSRQLLSEDDLEAGGADTLAALHAHAPRAFDVEFLVPAPLVTKLAVNQWRVGGAGKPAIGTRAAVVVRTVERLVEGLWHEPWEERWARFDGAPHTAQTVRWLRWLDAQPPSGDLVPDRRTQDELRAALDDCAELCALGLHDPLGTAGPGVDEVQAALHTGVPIMLWRRDGGDVTAMRTLVQDLVTAGRLHELAAELLRRRRARGAEGLGWHEVSVLWDACHIGRMSELALVAPGEDRGGHHD